MSVDEHEMQLALLHVRHVLASVEGTKLLAHEVQITGEVQARQLLLH